ncbi:MAG: glycoside hydrolase family 3 N-terminal domain-containing protein [Eubacteriales bacterium]|nr:glycoside hydrolase family 3 N-terminal domain-containing protein [Eubacteriales bacterium]
MVDLKAKPYYLNDSQIKWVEQTIAKLSIEEKIGQLFINLFVDLSPEHVRDFIAKYPVGGARYMGADADTVYTMISELQKNTKIPLLVSCNCDSGGNGACKDGTYIASGAATEASGSQTVAYNVGLVSGRVAAAIGCNWNFDPCVDILFNWRNTIVNTRAYGTDSDTVYKYASSYIKGILQSNVATCVKHFPGDGTEERDQHLVLGVNELSVEEWDASFGKVYKQVIDDGVMSIMAGHIALPAYSKKLVPGMTYDEIMPATLAPELIDGLLRKQLGFNGLVVTDASHMLGMSGAMKRRDYVPQAIAAGCDMFLFFNDHEEDFGFMLDGYKRGVITEERLQDALYRILGLKAAIHLHELQATGELMPPKEGLAIVGCEEHLTMAAEAADLAITLVKNTKAELPISAKTHKRLRLHTLYGEMGGIHGNTNASEKIIIEELEKAGYEVTLVDGTTRDKGKTARYDQDYDAAFVFADISGYAAENNYRIRWKCPMSNDIPWFVWEIPTVFISLNYTTHLTDVPMVKTYINAYNNSREVIRQTLAKIAGESDFKGQYNDLVWCKKWEAKR